MSGDWGQRNRHGNENVLLSIACISSRLTPFPPSLPFSLPPFHRTSRASTTGACRSLERSKRCQRERRRPRRARCTWRSTPDISGWILVRLLHHIYLFLLLLLFIYLVIKLLIYLVIYLVIYLFIYFKINKYFLFFIFYFLFLFIYLFIYLFILLSNFLFWLFIYLFFYSFKTQCCLRRLWFLPYGNHGRRPQQRRLRPLQCPGTRKVFK